MRQLMSIDWSKPQSLLLRLGPGVQAFLYGSVAKDTAAERSDLDVYVAGARASAVEQKYAFSRPLVRWQGRTYPLHVIGPETTDVDTFMASQTEARRVL